MPGFWNKIGQGLGYAGASLLPDTADRVRGQREAQAAAERERQLQEMIRNVTGGDPQRMLEFALDPKGSAESMRKSRDPLLMGEGQTVYQGGQPQFTAPKTGFQGDVPFAQQGANVQYGQARPMTYQETETATNNAADNSREDLKLQEQISQFAKTFGLDERELSETIRAHRANEGLGQQRERRIGAGTINPAQVQWDP